MIGAAAKTRGGAAAPNQNPGLYRKICAMGYHETWKKDNKRRTEHLAWRDCERGSQLSNRHRHAVLLIMGDPPIRSLLYTYTRSSKHARRPHLSRRPLARGRGCENLWARQHGGHGRSRKRQTTGNVKITRVRGRGATQTARSDFIYVPIFDLGKLNKIRASLAHVGRKAVRQLVHRLG